MTPREFLEAVVRPNVAEFHDNYRDLRRAYNAVAAVDSLAAHLYEWLSTGASPAIAGIPNDSHYRGALAGRNGEFALLRDVAKAQKHVRLTQGSPQVTSAAQVTSREIGWGEGAFGKGRLGGVTQVVVDLLRGSECLERLVDKALAFLEAEMVNHGA